MPRLALPARTPAFIAVAFLLVLPGCPDQPTGAGTEGDDTGTTATGGPSTTTDPTGQDTTAGTSGPPPGCPAGPLPAPSLASPADGSADQPIELSLCWDPVESDPGPSVRYRVLVDGIDLTEDGTLGEPGVVDTCLGPINLNYEQEYAWQVQAFAPGCEGTESGPSETWTFLTGPDGITVTVFEDDFSGDEGWEIGGDALEGAWIRGNPVPTSYSGSTAQPGDCAGGDLCMFTGQNPLGVVSAADVDGGSTTLTSPPFDPSPYAALSITLDRFFFKSSFPQSGTQLLVELLIPDAASPTGYQAIVLEQLDSEDQAAGANTWTPKEYVACGVQMIDGTRLRLTATDLGDGILEAAVDDVVVRGHTGTSVCDGGEGSICDPNAETPCTGDLLCCAQGTFNHGIHRCAPPVPSITYPSAGGPLGTFNGPLGCDAPDLFVRQDAVAPYEADVFVEADSCLLYEGCVGGPGWRHVLRFNTNTPNAGSRDLTMGVPSNHPDLYHYSECHAHYHFDGYANYELVDGGGAVVATGHKQAFCLIDLVDWSGWNNWNYNCGNQGISVGMGDVYGAGLDCQFIDVTDVAAGDYVLRIELNQPLPDTAVPPLVERDYGNNIAEVPVTLVGA